VVFHHQHPQQNVLLANINVPVTISIPVTMATGFRMETAAVRDVKVTLNAIHQRPVLMETLGVQVVIPKNFVPMVLGPDQIALMVVRVENVNQHLR